MNSIDEIIDFLKKYNIVNNSTSYCSFKDFDANKNYDIVIVDSPQEMNKVRKNADLIAIKNCPGDEGLSVIMKSNGFKLVLP